jgi:hypothetical protein
MAIVPPLEMFLKAFDFSTIPMLGDVEQRQHGH